MKLPVKLLGWVMLVIYSCGAGEKDNHHTREPTLPDTSAERKKDTSTEEIVETSAGIPVIDDYIMEGFENEEFTIVFSEEGFEISERQTGYQHGHTLVAMAMNYYKNEKMIFTDTIPMYADPTQYEITRLEDHTPVLCIKGYWSNFGASSVHENFYVLENDSIVPLNPVSGYCGGDHYNFDADSTCISPFLDGYEFSYTLSRKKGEKWISVIKKGHYLENEDPCKNGLDTTFIMEKSVIGRDSMVIFYSEETSFGKRKIITNESKQKAIKKLNSYEK